MQDYTPSLAAGVAFPIETPGDYFQVLEAASPVYLAFDSGSFIKRVAGQGNSVDPYTNVQLKSDVAQNVRVSLGFVGNAAPVDGAGKFSGTVQAQFGVPDQANGIASVAVPATGSAVIAAANANRLALRLALASDAAGAVLLSGAGQPAAGVGGLLEPGMVDYVPITADVSAYNPNATAITVYVLELNKV